MCPVPRSRTSCVQPRGELPDLFLDRSLGRKRVPQLLREAGLTLVTLAERYSMPADELVPDHEWLAECGLRQEVVFLKDARVRYNVAEKATITRLMFHRCMQGAWRIAVCGVRGLDENTVPLTLARFWPGDSHKPAGAIKGVHAGRRGLC